MAKRAPKRKPSLFKDLNETIDMVNEVEGHEASKEKSNKKTAKAKRDITSKATPKVGAKLEDKQVSSVRMIAKDWEELDLIARRSKTKRGNGVSRTEVVQALIKYFLKKGIKIEGASSVEDVLEILLKK